MRHRSHKGIQDGMEKLPIFESRFIDSISYLLLMQPPLCIFSRGIKPERCRIWPSPTHYAIDRHLVEGLDICLTLPCIESRGFLVRRADLPSSPLEEDSRGHLSPSVRASCLAPVPVCPTVQQR